MISRRLKTSLAATVVVFAGFGAYCTVLAQGEDRDLVWTREVPLEAAPDHTAKAIHALVNWKNWVFSGEEIERIDALGRVMTVKDQFAEKGALLTFHINPHKGEHRKFELQVEITDYEPGKSLELRVLKDSSGRLTKLFSGLTWKLEILPAEGSQGPRLRGTEHARTQHWRSRVFSRLSERILMHQAYFLDLLKLSTITQPLDVNPRPLHEQ
jgi:hypothetical protein